MIQDAAQETETASFSNFRSTSQHPLSQTSKLNGKDMEPQARQFITPLKSCGNLQTARGTSFITNKISQAILHGLIISTAVAPIISMAQEICILSLALREAASTATAVYGQTI